MKDSFFRKSLLVGVAFMFSGVLLGAFGAHGLKPVVDEYAMDIFEKGVFYQFIHALGLLISTIVIQGKSLKWVFRFFTIGIFFFSFSLYLLALRQFLSDDVVRIIGPITPIGGVFFILGWIVIFQEIWKMTIKSNNSEN